MPTSPLGTILSRLRTLLDPADAAATDRELLQRFVAHGDETAFSELARRHGPMVLGVCRRLLYDPQQAEDAFQAVFLVLAPKAGVVQQQPLVGPWLYGVASRVAMRLRGRTSRRREREDSSADMNALPAPEAACSEVRWVVHEEVQRLRDVYRSAVVLCFLEGKTNEKTARLLRGPVGTVKSRLMRARELLRKRLTRRGMALANGAPEAMLAANAAPGPAALAGATIWAVVPFAAGEAVGVFVTARAVALSQGVLQTMLLTKVKTTAVLLLAVIVFGMVGGLAYRAWAAGPGDCALASARSADKPTDDHAAIQGLWRVVSIEMDGKERTDADAKKVRNWYFVEDQFFLELDALAPGKVPIEAAYAFKLDPKQAPKSLELFLPPLPNQPAEQEKPKPIKKGQYSLEGDALTITCSGLRPNKGGSNEEVGHTVLYTLKRVIQDKDKPKETADAEAIQGTWIAVSGDAEGKEASAEELKDFEVLFTADKLVFNPKGDNRASSYKLDPTKTPKGIEVTPQDGPAKGKAIHGLYELDGDRLKLCIQNGNGKDPTEFATKPGSGLRLLVLKRKPADEKPNEDKPKADREALQGAWRVISVEVAGKEATDRAEEEWVVKDGWITSRSKGQSLFRRAVFAVHSDKSPKEIDINPYPVGLFMESDVDKGIYTLDGDVWKVCLPHLPLSSEAAERPKEMGTKEGGKTVLITLKRVAEKDKPKDDAEAIQGTWRVIALETEGVRQTPSQQWVFTANKVVIKNEGNEAEVQETEYTFAIDPTQSPKTLDLTRPSGQQGVKGQTKPMIYSLEGEVLKVGRLLSAPEIQRLDQLVGRRPRVAELRDLFVTRPAELATKEGSKSTVLTLERVK